MPRIPKKPSSSNNIVSVRATRSKARANPTSPARKAVIEIDAVPEAQTSTSTAHEIKALPAKLTAAITGLSRQDHAILLKKQRWLQTYKVDIPKGAPAIVLALDATLVFAQEEAGTAVCISIQGLLLTCSHCIAETIEELDYSKIHWLLFSSGIVVSAKCIKWDGKRDLALLQITAAQPDPTVPSPKVIPTSFAHISLAPSPPAVNTPLCCIGHPGSEDLEATRPGIKTNYDVLHVSEGQFHGYAEGQDRQDNSEIGALMYDCWTYWGHSGAPIVSAESGELVGLHSSWDEETGMRRGVGVEAVEGFLVEQKR